MGHRMIIMVSLTVLIGIVFVLFTRMSSKYRKRLNSSKLACPMPDDEGAFCSDTRNDGRMSLQCPVILEVEGERIESRTNNLSISGAFIVHPNPLNIGERLYITLDIPDQNEITLEAQVLWNNMALPSDKVVSRGMGVRFIGISKESRDSINRMLLQKPS